jgi:Domain of unknown function (DUF4262)
MSQDLNTWPWGSSGRNSDLIMVQSIGTDDGERKVLADIAKFGWHSLNILDQGDKPGWRFTIGLYQTWQHPELIVFGLKRDVVHSVLSIVANGLAEGRRIDLSRPTDELLENGSCVFVEVPKACYREHVGFARWYYQGDAFPLYQIVWPSREGYFPWQPKASESHWQPVLGQMPKGA